MRKGTAAGLKPWKTDHPGLGGCGTAIPGISVVLDTGYGGSAWKTA